jgi:hypothetical protein
MSLQQGTAGGKPPSFAVRTQVGEGPPRAKGQCAPFAAMPHAIGSDTRLSPTERVLVLALLAYARDRDRCTPSNAGLAAYVGCSTATVKRALGELEVLGYVRTARCRPSAENATGRTITLAWREDPATLPAYRRAERPRPAPRIIDEPPPGPSAPPEGDVAVEDGAEKSLAGGTRPPSECRAGGGGNEGSVQPAQRERGADALAEDALVKRLLALGGPAAQQARRALARRQKPPGQAREISGPSAGLFAVALSRLAPGAPAQACAPPGREDTATMLARLAPGCDRRDVERAVNRLCRELADPHSQGFYAATLGDVRAGRLAVEAVTAAYGRAMGPRVRNRGAAFTAAVRSWGG